VSKFALRSWDSQQRGVDDRRGRTGTAVWIRSLKYTDVEEDTVLYVSDAILYVT